MSSKDLENNAYTEATATYTVTCTHKENATEFDIENDCDFSELDTLENEDLPLTLKSGRMYDFSTSKTDLGGNPDFPSSFDFDFRFWYENNTGTLGYENSIFHFERKATVQFAPYCTDISSGVLTAVAKGLYDPCQNGKQLFTVDLLDENGKGLEIPSTQTDCAGLLYCNDIYSVHVVDAALSPVPTKNTEYRFAVRKCTDASCAYYTKTGAYLYSLTVADGDNLATTYKSKSHSDGSTSVIPMKAYKKDARQGL